MPNRRQLLLSGCAGMALGARVPIISQVFAKEEKGRLNLGLSGLGYYLNFCPFLNWAKMASAHDVTRNLGEKISGKAVFDLGYADSTSGEIANPVPNDATAYTRLFFVASRYPDYSGEQWTIKWEGTGHCAIGGLTAGGSQVIDNGAGSGSFKFGTKPGNTWFTIRIADIKDPPRNIRIFQTRYAANVMAGETFNPDWLAQIRNFGILRFMDWMATNNSEIAEFSQIADEQYFAWGQRLASSSSYGPKGGVPLSIICKLANLTKCNIHFCIPHLATDACVKSIAAYFRDHLEPQIVTTFEYSNECWNFGFQQTAYCRIQAQAMVPPGGVSTWYGYRSAQCMKIIRDVFDDRSRWRGCLATLTVNVGVTKLALIGVDYFRANDLSPANSLTVTDLFDEISVTGYFGNVQGSRRLNSISNSNPAVVTCPSHGYNNGQRLKLFVATGMTELNDTFATVANATKDTYELAGVDSTSYKTSIMHDRNYTNPALVFELMDKSAAQNLSDPTHFPTKYTYFNKLCAASWLTGEAEGLLTSVSVKSLTETFWPAQKAIADAHGLDLRQYEGGSQYVGDLFLAGYGGNPQFTEYLVNIGNTEETAEVYAAMYAAFFQVGGHYPAKFVEATSPGPFGTWGGMRFIPGDESNPVWVATLAANGR